MRTNLSCDGPVIPSLSTIESNRIESDERRVGVASCVSVCTRITTIQDRRIQSVARWSADPNEPEPTCQSSSKIERDITVWLRVDTGSGLATQRTGFKTNMAMPAHKSNTSTYFESGYDLPTSRICIAITVVDRVPNTRQSLSHTHTAIYRIDRIGWIAAHMHTRQRLA